MTACQTIRYESTVRDVVLSLYDLTGNMVEPWIEAGYTAYIVDVQHKDGIHPDKANPRLIRVGADIRFGWMPPREIIDRIAFAAALPPCDHLAVSGARWFKGKGLRKLALSVDLFATAAELLEWIGAPYLIENPVSTISSYWRKPDFTFDPFDYAGIEPDDNYTKKTCLWVGNGLEMPPPQPGIGLPPPRQDAYPSRAAERRAIELSQRYVDGFRPSSFRGKPQEAGDRSVNVMRWIGRQIDAAIRETRNF